ncbi:MAG: acetyl-CoA C-acyltransferase [Acidobacteriota bacterium]
MQDAVIVTAVRTPVGKARRGTLRDMRPDDLAAIVIGETVRRTPGLQPVEVEDVILGCAMPEAEQGMNVARIASLRAGLPVEVPAITINRFCASGLQSIAFACERVRCGSASLVLAGGTESMSLIPMAGHRFQPNPYLVETYPDVYLSMGLTAENLVNRYNISRDSQDRFALQSHQKALQATREGRFRDEMVPVELEIDFLDEQNRKQQSRILFAEDEGPRADTSLEALSTLKPAFHATGTVTAGNSSQMSDGAAAALVASREVARDRGWTPMGRFVSYATAGVAPEEMGIGPVNAIPKALKLAGLELDQIGLIELNEAFAAQALTVIQEAGLDPSRVNVNGGAIALGHPLGCTGAKLTATLLFEMKRRQVQFGMVTMCVGGGMGAAGIFELI